MSFDPFIVRCSECGSGLDERRQVVWSKVEGWEKKRDQGGTNHVAMRRPLNEFMCANCMGMALAGLDPRQLAL